MKRPVFIKLIAAGIILASFFLYFCEKEPYVNTPYPSNPPGDSDTSTVTPFPVKEVNIINHHFSPQSLNAVKGASVNWTNKDSVSHTVTSLDGKFESGHMEPGKNYLFQFTGLGSFGYFCRYHKESGKITIQ